ncbi:MAG: carbon monoxide dehydrogenase [Nitriliruptorales bacterium]|nr:carbon monoxide dehydrogenase [Nitriliruptorales bacterium]
MKVTGSTVLNAPREQVWGALIDPAVLVRTIPGCEQLTQVGPDSYRATVNAGVASIKGVYSGEVKLTDQAEPSAFVLHASGAGAPGTVSADVRVTLAEADGGGTRLDYDADAIVGGMIGGVGQRMLTSMAKRTADEFFAAVNDELTGRAELAAPAVGVPGVTGAPVVATQPGQPTELVQPAQPRTFTAPSRSRAGVPVSVVISAAVVGALIALDGVLVGWLIAA